MRNSGWPEGSEGNEAARCEGKEKGRQKKCTAESIYISFRTVV